MCYCLTSKEETELPVWGKFPIRMHLSRTSAPKQPAKGPISWDSLGKDCTRAPHLQSPLLPGTGSRQWHFYVSRQLGEAAVRGPTNTKPPSAYLSGLCFIFHLQVLEIGKVPCNSGHEIWQGQLAVQTSTLCFSPWSILRPLCSSCEVLCPQLR